MPLPGGDLLDTSILVALIRQNDLSEASFWAWGGANPS
jgi:hypothetical protein